ncbi:MAG: protein kinase [Planctomycetota bacterium]
MSDLPPYARETAHGQGSSARRAGDPFATDRPRHDPYGATAADASGRMQAPGGPPPEDPGNLRGGQVLDGRYELVEELGRGGMGVVFRARDLLGGGDVAVKLLLAAGLERQVKRFEREALALRSLAHRNVVEIHAVGVHRGLPYLVLDFVAGESLERRIQRGPLAPRAAAELVGALADALSHVHARGVLHRDLKPDNVLLEPDGTPRLTDFGLAGDLLGDAERLTNTGAMLGTPGYWPPEQLRGIREEVGPPADVYGLGGILYAALTQRRPIEGASFHEVVLATAERPVTPPSRLNPDVPPELERICLTCLAKDPADRYESAADLADALLAFAHAAPRARWRGPAWARALAWGVVGLGAVGATGAALGARAARAELAAREAAAARLDVPARLMRARFRREQGDAAGALADLEHAVDQGPLAGPALALRGEVLAELAGDQPGAERSFDAALERELVPALRAAVLTSRGVVRHRQGKLEEALADYERALALQPAGSTYANRAAYYATTGRFAEAEADFGRALALNPREGGARSGRAWARIRLQRYREAIADCDAALALDPANGRAYHHRALARIYGQFEPELVAADLDAAVRLRPDDAEVLYSRATYRRQARDLEGARSDLDRALQLTPDNPRHRATRGLVRGQQGDLAGGIEDLEGAIPRVEREDQPFLTEQLERMRAKLKRQPERR